MVRTNRAQREALYRIYDLGRRSASMPITYRAFRKQVQPGPGCIMIPYVGMWLGIEPDGYTHS